MINKSTVLNLINEKIEEVGQKFYLVDLKISGSNKIIVEMDHEERKISIDDCIMFSRQVEHNLDREEEDFELEVSSAGMSNPFKVHKQYIKHQGRDVKVMLKGGKVVEGELSNVTDSELTISYTKKEKVEGKKKKIEVEVVETYSFDEINQTKLVITFK